MIYELYNLKKSEKFTKDELKNYQYIKIKKLIEYAYNNFEIYKLKYDEFGVSPEDFKNIKDLKKFPIVNKDDLKKEVHKMSSDKNIWMQTTGSTGTPFKFPIDKKTLSVRRASEIRTNYWFNHRLFKKTGILWRNVIGGNRKLKIKEKILRRKFYSTFDTRKNKKINLDENTIIAYYEDMKKEKIKHIYASVSAMLFFCKIVRKNKLTGLKLDNISVGGEVLTKSAKKYIQDTFKTRVYNRYGNTEVSLIAHEHHDIADDLIVQSDKLYLELVRDLKLPKNKGRVVVTDFYNYALPFIRYDTGDYAEKSNKKNKFNFKMIKNIEGRINDIFYLKDGSTMNSHIFHNILRKYPSVSNFKILQKNYEIIEFYFVSKVNKKLEMELKNLLRGIKLIFNYVDKIPLGVGGKHRHIESMIKKDIDLLR